jgi:exodeoxyribonuclease-3
MLYMLSKRRIHTYLYSIYERCQLLYPLLQFSLLMKIISWNTNGLRGTVKQGNFEPLFRNFKPDIVCLQETKSEASQLEDSVKNISGYSAYFCHSKRKKGYSGTAIFTKEEPLALFYDFPQAIRKQFALHEDSFGNPNDEGRILTAEYKKFYLVNVYTPNSKPDLSRLQLRDKLWDPAFLSYVKTLEKKKPVIFCGDLNVAHTEEDLANAKANVGEHGFTNEERVGIDKIIKAGFVDTFRMFTKGKGHYTWWTHFANARARNVGWRIDYFFVSKKLASKVKKSEILADYMGSDHCPILLEIAV